MKSGQYVEIIHTNTGILGIEETLGHADFYPNNGYDQTGCENAEVCFDVCAHSRAYEYFAESINSKTGFIGKNKNIYRKMGGVKRDPIERGIYKLSTNKGSPFAKG